MRRWRGRDAARLSVLDLVAPGSEIQLRIALSGRVEQRAVPDLVAGRREAEQLELPRRRLLDERHPFGCGRPGLYRVEADPVVSGALVADVQQVPRAAGRGEVDAAVEDVGPVREERSPHAA